jgi:hypothetical protein
MLIVLLSAAHSYHCAHTLQITTTTPQHLSYVANEDDIICINSTRPYLTVTFEHTNLLAVRFFSPDEFGERLLKRGRFVYPSEANGVAFGEVHGHVEVRALLAGALTISAFAFPADCGEYRYVWTAVDAQILVQADATHDVCVWSPQYNYTVVPRSGQESGGVVTICEGVCALAPPGTHFHATSAEYLRLSQAPQWAIGVHVKSAGRFLASAELIDNRRIVKVINVQPRTVEVIEAAAAPPEAPPERKGLEDYIPKQFPVQHGQTNVLSPFEILSVIAVGVVVLTLVVQCYVCPPGRPRGGIDDAETRLLGAYQPSQYPAVMQPASGFGYAPPGAAGYHVPFRMPNQGYFPSVPDGQNTENL